MESTHTLNARRHSHSFNVRIPATIINDLDTNFSFRALGSRNVGVKTITAADTETGTGIYRIQDNDHWLGITTVGDTFIFLPLESKSTGRQLVFFDLGPTTAPPVFSRTFNTSTGSIIVDFGYPLTKDPQWFLFFCDGETWNYMRHDTAP